MFRAILSLLAAVSGASVAFAQRQTAGGYEVASAPWDQQLGNHRAVVRVAAPADAVRSRIEWRRRDPNPETKAVLVVDARTGRTIANVLVEKSTNEVGDIVFQPESGAGDYYVYILPAKPATIGLPELKYMPPQNTAAEAWLARLRSANAALPTANLVRLESRTEFDRFTEMEVIATAQEVAALQARLPDRAFFVFPEDRLNAIRMADHLPQRWGAGPPATFRLSGDRNEYRVFQLGLWSATHDLKNVRVAFSGLRSPAGGLIATSAIECFNFGGVDQAGVAFTRQVDVARGKVQAIWCGIDTPQDAAPGDYTGEAVISADGLAPAKVAMTLGVSSTMLADRGDSEPWRMTKLRWLNSRIAVDDQVTSWFKPLTVKGRNVHLLGHSISIGANGLPTQMVSYFNGSNTRITKSGLALLAAPVAFTVETQDGRTIPLRPSGFEWTSQQPGRADWTSTSENGGVRLAVSGSVEFDGHMTIRTNLTSAQPLAVRDVRLDVSRTPATARYLLGMSNEGRRIPATMAWTWDRSKYEDSAWIGEVNAGLRVQLFGDNYVRPSVNVQYRNRPLELPVSWHNDGKGGARLSATKRAVTFTAFSGPRTIAAGETLGFNVNLQVTPSRTLDTEAQWKDRYFHDDKFAKQTVDMDLAGPKAAGANIINLHHGSTFNPYINYPFLRNDSLKTMIARIHEQGLRAKLYYSVRELTNHTPELFALRSLGHETIVAGPGGGHAWLEEHLGQDYTQAWAEPHVYDAALTVSGGSRWNNLYLEGLQWLVRNDKLDGLYIDDVSFDRKTMQRVRKILERNSPNPMIDLHSWNPRDSGNEPLIMGTGKYSPALLYMEQFPYIDRIWFGEGFHYDHKDQDYWLTEISGIPYGVMSEMLEKGGNPWLGMLYGMSNRLGWQGNPVEIWKFWDRFGMSGTEMIGYWDKAVPVKTDKPDVVATVYRKPGRTLISLGNFGDADETVNLAIDFAKLGINPRRATLRALPIEGFQPAAEFARDAPIKISAKRGWLIVVEDRGQQ